MDYLVQFCFVPSNLGIGRRPYFKCPVTGKRAAVLYLLPDMPKFAHRSAQRLYYEKEIQNKEYRWLERTYGPDFERERLWEELTFPGKWRKRPYAGKETRWVREIKFFLGKFSL